MRVVFCNGCKVTAAICWPLCQNQHAITDSVPSLQHVSLACNTAYTCARPGTTCGQGMAHGGNRVKFLPPLTRTASLIAKPEHVTPLQIHSRFDPTVHASELREEGATNRGIPPGFTKQAHYPDPFGDAPPSKLQGV